MFQKKKKKKILNLDAANTAYILQEEFKFKFYRNSVFFFFCFFFPFYLFIFFCGSSFSSLVAVGYQSCH